MQLMRWFTLLFLLLLSGCGADWFPSTPAPLSSPTAFFFDADTTTTPATATTSKEITLAGTDTSGWTVKVEDVTTGANSQISINGTTYLPGDTNIPRVVPGDKIKVTHTSATLASGVSTTKVTIGGFAATYTTNTVSGSLPSPTAFFFDSDFTRDAGLPKTSKTITLAGTNPGDGWPVSVSDVPTDSGASSFITIDGTDYFPGFDIPNATPGQKITVTHTPSATPYGVSTTRVIIGGYSTTYTTITFPVFGEATGPEPFTFPDATASVVGGGASLSDPVTIVGDNPNGWTITYSDAPAANPSELIINGAFFIPGGTLPTIFPGDTLQVSQTPAPSVGGTKITTITIGTTTATFKTTSTL